MMSYIRAKFRFTKIRKWAKFKKLLKYEIYHVTMMSYVSAKFKKSY